MLEVRAPEIEKELDADLRSSDSDQLDATDF